VSVPAGIGGISALIAHKAGNLDSWEKVIATATKELAVDSNFSSMSMNYNVDNTINYIDIVKSVGGTSVTVRLSFSYNVSGLINGITKAVV
jgi:hypothetical protein